MTTLQIKTDLKLPKNVFENIDDLKNTLNALPAEEDFSAMSLKEYIQSGAIDRDESVFFNSVEDLIKDLNSKS